MKMNGFADVSVMEMEMIDGGGVWGAVATGVLAVGAVALAVACAPVGVAVGVVVAYHALVTAPAVVVGVVGTIAAYYS